ncbi:cistern family PEP-CTERM protein [Novosphingobium aquimarinum]|uniref:cistern family PEP-CTERM protein n=1 Tax=Novosphingobium aquimarinum TaxID=2682494 RepID=UPI0012EB5122|nr:cistern family PEP-CTERM protein [Novosphingobium aquimarinum]
MNRKLTAIVLAVSALFSTPALADSIVLDASDIGTSFDLSFDGFTGGSTIDGLSSTATFTLTGINGNNYNFDYVIANTSSDPVTASRLSGFAFNTDPDIISATSTGDFAYTSLGKNYPNGIGNVDVCFKDASTGSCAGGGSGGLLLGETGTGSFSLSFAEPIQSVTLSDFYTRYQSIDAPGMHGGSASGAGTITTTSGGSTSGGTTPVPEPGMLGLFGSALIATAVLRRRRRQARSGRGSGDRLISM